MFGATILICVLFIVVMNYQFDMEGVYNHRIKSLNTRGYLSVTPYIRHLLEECDILTINEHWLHENRLNLLSEMSTSYNVFARSNQASRPENYGSTRGQGGVAVFWRKDLPGISVVSDIIHDRVCVIRMQTSNGTILYFFSIYMPAQGCNEDLEFVLDKLSEILESREGNSICILCGDFNGDVGNVGEYSGTRNPTQQGTLVYRFLQRHNLVACNMLTYATSPLHTFESHNAHTTLDNIAIPSLVVPKVKRCWVAE